jgi:hypothetical protein
MTSNSTASGVQNQPRGFHCNTTAQTLFRACQCENSSSMTSVECWAWRSEGQDCAACGSRSIAFNAVDRFPPPLRPPQRPHYVCAVSKAALSSGCKAHWQPLQPEATEAVMEVTKWLKPSVWLVPYR